MSTQISIAQKLEIIRSKISAAEKRAGRESGSVKLMAVSKFHPVEAIKEANEIGIEIGINDGYRSEEEQEEIQSRLKEIKGIEYVQQYVAEAGYSEHHTALAIDVGLRQNGQLIQENEEGNVKKEIYERLHPLLAKYGFILRYPKGKEEITGYRYEPWHIRYIKDKEKASEIMANNLSLEE